MRLVSRHHRPHGFTLVELSIAILVLTMLSIFAGQIYLNYTSAARNLKGANLVYEEARFLMEKIVREIRQNGIDYEQYFNQNIMIPTEGGGFAQNLVPFATEGGGDYTDNYCAYSSIYYDNGPDNDFWTLKDNDSTGTRNPEWESWMTDSGATQIEAAKSVENELYLINIAGTKRSVLTRVVENVNGDMIGKVALLKMDGQDFGTDHINGRNPSNASIPVSDPSCHPDEGENDGLIDSWLCSPGFSCLNVLDTPSATIAGCAGLSQVAIKDPADPNYSFVDISPNALNVVDLKFMIAPADDPWKAYSMNDYQIQPHVTIQMTVNANPKLVTTGQASPPSITLTSTITARNYDEIKSDCGK